VVFGCLVCQMGRAVAFVADHGTRREALAWICAGGA
jgi:hypothetical protein